MLLKAHKISKRFSKPHARELFKEISLSVEPGESVAITGASGEGKSTLLHILGTLDLPSDGKVTILGHDVSAFNRAKLRREHMGFIFQGFHLLEEYTVLENVLMPARIARKEGKHFLERAYFLLEKVGLKEKVHFRTHLLSGGEKQRVALARALLLDPKLLLADEPSGNLDPVNAQEVHTLLLSLTQLEQKGLIVVTHNLELAAKCAKKYTLSQGTLHGQ